MTVDRFSVRPEIRATLAVAAPLAAANLAHLAIQVTNTIIVGHLGATALAAAGLGASLNATLLMICQGVLTAVAPLAAHAIGAGDRRRAGRLAGAGLVLAAILTGPVVIMLTVIPRLLPALGYDPALAAEIGRFLGAIRWGAPAFLGFSVLRFLLIASFRTRIVMVVPLLAVPLNAALNWLLVFGHLGLPAWGIVGSGCATAIIQWLMLSGVALYMLLVPAQIPVRIARRIFAEIPRILRVGLPIGALLGLEIGLFVATGITMGVLGADALGAHQLVFNVAGLTFMVPLGLAQAATVRVAFRLGAGQPAAARQAGFIALALGAAFMTAMALLLWAAPRTIAGLYIDLGDSANRGLVAIAMRLFLIAALFQVFDGVQVIAVGALRGYRDTAGPLLIAALGYWGVGFAGGWLLGFPLGYGPVGLWLGMALGLAVVSVALTLRLLFRARGELHDAEPRLAAAQRVRV